MQTDDNVQHTDGGLILTIDFSPDELEQMLINAKAGGSVELMVRLDIATAITIKGKEVRLR